MYTARRNVMECAPRDERVVCRYCIQANWLKGKILFSMRNGGRCLEGFDYELHETRGMPCHPALRLMGCQIHIRLDIKPITTPSNHLARNNSLAIDIHNLRIIKLATIGYGLLGTDGIAHFAPRIPSYIPQVFERAGIAYPRPETGNFSGRSRGDRRGGDRRLRVGPLGRRRLSG